MLLAVLVLSACGGGDNEALPTRFELPTVAPTASPEPTTIAQAATEAAQPATDFPASTAAGATATPTDFNTPTVTPSRTITDTPTATLTPTPIPTLDPGPVDFLAEIARNATVLPQEFLTGVPPVTNVTVPPPVVSPGGAGVTPTPNPASACQYLPPGGFGALLLNQPGLIARIGCPVGTPPDTLSLAAAYQPFENGAMYWLNEGPGYITVLYPNGSFRRFDDTFTEGVDPESGGESAPDGRFEPVRGFGKVWRDNALVRDALGWATQSEAGTQATVQDFDGGRMVYLPARGNIVILIYQGGPTTGTWEAAAGTF